MSDPFLAREAPSGWSSPVLGDVATLQRGFDLPIQNRTEGRHPVYGSNGIDGFNDKAMLPGPGVITGRSGTIGLVHYEESAYWPLNTTLYVKNFHGNDERYIYYFLQTLNLSRFVAATGVPSLNRNFVHPLPVVMPPLPQQHKIARILTTVDNLIEKTEALIAKYQAIKQGMMHDLFTRGVDEHGHLRPPYEQAPELYKQSEMGWIPKEWDVRQVRDVAGTITSGSRGWAAYYSDEGAVFVRIGNLTREHINFRWESIQRVQPPRSSEGERTALKPGDVLVSVTADLGIVGVVPDGVAESYINQHIAMIRLQSNTANPRWLGRSLSGRMGREQFERLNDSGAKAGLNLPAVGRLRFVDAPRHEQDSASLAIDRFESQIEIEKGQLAKLQQVKTGLMQDLLTGKVRVKVDEAEEDKA